METWMIMYQIRDGIYDPVSYGRNLIPTENYDKVILVPEEIARQADKFDFDGSKLKRKNGVRIHTVDELDEMEKAYAKELSGKEDGPTPQQPEVTIEM